MAKEKTEKLPKEKEVLENKPKKKVKKRKIWKLVLLIILAVIILTVSVFAVGIYGFSWQNKPTRFMAKIIPYPTVLMLDKYFPFTHEIRISTLWSQMDSVQKYFN